MSVTGRYLSPFLFAADFSVAENTNTPKSFSIKTARDFGFKESWLQEAIIRNPDLVLAPCREAGLFDPRDERWAFWAKEVPIRDAGGISIDILMVSEFGRIGIVETKLFENPEARRAVVAQVLEYAINFDSVRLSNLPPLPTKDSSGVPFDLQQDDVRDRMQESDYLLIIAGDRIEARAVKLSEELLGKHLLHSWTLGVVEIAIFSDDLQKRQLLVPHLRNVIIPVERQVVRVENQGDRTRLVIAPSTPVAPERKWDENGFFARAEHLGGPLLKFAQDLRQLRDDNQAEITLAFGRGAAPTVTLRKNSQGILTLNIEGSGSLGFNKHAFARALGEHLGRHYGENLESLFPEAMKMDWATVKLRADTAEAHLASLSALLQEVLAKSEQSHTHAAATT